MLYEKLISDNFNKDVLNQENIIIKKMELRNGTISNNSLNVSYLNTGEFINSNILAKGKIFENIEEYIFYDEQSHKIEDSDFPEKNEENENKGLSAWAIVGIILGVIILIGLGVFLFIYFRKKRNIDFDISKEEKISLTLDKEINN